MFAGLEINLCFVAFVKPADHGRNSPCEAGNMKRIEQVDELGCGIACIAMLAGVSYSHARKTMFGQKEVESTYTRHLRKALRKYGLLSASRLRPLKTKTYHDLPHDAILKANVKNNGKEWHWLVWDASAKRPLDPYRSRLTPRPRVVSFLEVRR